MYGNIAIIFIIILAPTVQSAMLRMFLGVTTVSRTSPAPGKRFWWLSLGVASFLPLLEPKCKITFGEHPRPKSKSQLAFECSHEVAVPPCAGRA